MVLEDCGRISIRLGVCSVLALSMVFSSLLIGSVAAQEAPAGSASIYAVQQGFANPPDDARVMMRWWWFGPAVTKPELKREILAMKSGGIGGFEIQPVYPMELDDDTTGFRNLPYLSDEFLDAVKFTSQTARENGMRVDMTLASGWPYGGVHVSVDQAASRLRVVATEVPAGLESIAVPAIGNGERLIAAFMGEGTAKEYDASKLQRIEVQQLNGRMAVALEIRPRVAVFFVASRTGQQVKRAAVNAEGFVLDHLSRAAVEDHLKIVGDRLMKAFGDKPPYAVFSDSLEVYGTDWTDDLLPEFARRRGYDLTPYLPELASGSDEISAEVRHDWGLTITELIDERYLTPVDDWAKAHGTRFRSQTYGTPAVSMSSNRLVTLPEGEGPQWNRFSYTRWATSASHLYGRPVTSAETWTWLHSPPFRATPLDMKAEADRFFLEGVNQLIGHGWPYTPPGISEPGWSFYAAAVFNDHNPWWIVMPDVTKYLQRVSYLLRQGKPANDIAVLLPNDDVYAEFTPGKASISDGMPKYITPELMQQILGAGHNVDYIDAEAIQRVGIPYPVLVMPHVERLSPKTMKAISAYVSNGGKVIAVGSTPSKAPGFKDAAAISAEVSRLSHAIFANAEKAQMIAKDEDLGVALKRVIAADLQLSDGAFDVGFLHRKLNDADIYFVANTSNHKIKSVATFGGARRYISSWDAFAGDTDANHAKDIVLNLAPYESRVIVFSDSPIGKAQVIHEGSTKVVDRLTHDWKLKFSGVPIDRTIETPGSWTEDPKTRFYSGVGVYTKTIHLSADELNGTHSLVLDFGEGTPVAADPKIKSGMRALLEGPIREAAVVMVNGQRAGSVWHPPYALDVTKQLRVGDNLIEIQVANTAINLLAGRAPADYRLLNLRYGERFTMQDMDHLEPIPSGLIGIPQLLEMK